MAGQWTGYSNLYTAVQTQMYILCRSNPWPVTCSSLAKALSSPPTSSTLLQKMRKSLFLSSRVMLASTRSLSALSSCQMTGGSAWHWTFAIFIGPFQFSQECPCFESAVQVHWCIQNAEPIADSTTSSSPQSSETFFEAVQTIHVVCWALF